MAVNALWTIFDYEEYERWYNEMEVGDKIPFGSVLKKREEIEYLNNQLNIVVVEDARDKQYRIPSGMLQYYNAQINSPKLYRMLGDIIATKRTKADITQEELGMLIGVGRQVILRLESGKSQCKFDIVLAIAKVLNINLMEII